MTGTKGLVIKQAADFEANQPKVSYINRPLPPLGNPDGGSKLEGNFFSNIFCSKKAHSYRLLFI